jgi:ATP-dependent DNA helicase PIF1
MQFGKFSKSVKRSSTQPLETKRVNHSLMDETPTVQITSEFQQVLDSIEMKNKFTFVTGMAGSGKSTLIDLIKEKFDLKFVLVAPTGIAALNIGGSTVHSVFRLPFGPCPEAKELEGHVGLILKHLDLLIIDEISMVRADLLDAISMSLQKHKKNKQPFGGVQIAAFGDLFQLPPVVSGDDKAILFEKYESEYFFSAKCLEQIAPQVIVLSKIFRQQDPVFQSVLSSLRRGHDIEKVIEYINSKCFDPEAALSSGLTLTTRTAQADEINQSKLSMIKSTEHTFSAYIEGKYFSNKSDKSLPAPSELKLKVGARVIMSKNCKGVWVNGDLGTITLLGDDKIRVKLDRGQEEFVYKEQWQHYRYVYNAEVDKVEKEIIATFTQYPIRLGWAVTVHKSQGLTLGSCTVDTGPFGAFLHGQVYVALSRCKSIESLRLKRKLKISDVILDPIVAEFYKVYEQSSLTLTGKV